jgi:TRAP-type mannitol/chloroaromatic compound transport system substrate-binding protein
LIPGPEVFNAVKRGMVPIGITSSAYDLAQVPIFNVVAGLPFNFANEWEGVYFHKWLGLRKDGPGRAVEKSWRSCFTDRIYTTELSLKKPVRTMEDFKGLKLRSSGILQKYLTSIGAAATMIPGGDIYAGLASGMLDGAHWGAVQGSSSMKFYEVSKYHLRPALNVAATDIWVINKKAFDRLPEDLQQILVSTLEEHFWRRTNQYIYQEALELAKIQKEQNVTLAEHGAEEFAKCRRRPLKSGMKSRPCPPNVPRRSR